MEHEVLLITGASSDIGARLIASQLEHLPDQRIIAHYAGGEERIRTLEDQYPDNVFGLRCDLLDGEARASLPLKLDAMELVPTKILHLAAPRLQLTRFKDLCRSDLQREFEIQLFSIVELLQHCLPRMKKQKSGNVVFMLSSNTLATPASSMSAYTVGKYSLLGLMQSLVAEYKGSGIRFNAVSPSMIETGFLREVPERLVEFTAEGHPLKRNACVDDVVPLIEFLLSEKSAYLNGVNIPLTGGQ